VDKGSGKIDVKRVVCAQDMGQVVNPQGAAIQMEGCITMGLGYALAAYTQAGFITRTLAPLIFFSFSSMRAWLAASRG